MKQWKFNLLATVAAVHGGLCQDAQYHAGSGFGDPRNLTQSPNATVSAPITVGNQSFTISLDVTEIVPGDNEPSDLDDPRIVYSQFSLRWPGDETLRDQLRESEGLSDDEEPFMCASFPFGFFGAGQTNAYGEDGDCRGPLGSECLDAITSPTPPVSVNWSQPGFLCSQFVLPDACYDRFPDAGGEASGLIVYPRATDDGDPTLSPLITQPYGFAYRNSEIYAAGDDTEYERATERLHVMILSGKQTNVSCLRVQDNRVSNGDPAVSRAERLKDQTLRSILLGALGAVLATAM